MYKLLNFKKYVQTCKTINFNFVTMYKRNTILSYVVPFTHLRHQTHLPNLLTLIITTINLKCRIVGPALIITNSVTLIFSLTC